MIVIVLAYAIGVCVGVCATGIGVLISFNLSYKIKENESKKDDV